MLDVESSIATEVSFNLVTSDDNDTVSVDIVCVVLSVNELWPSKCLVAICIQHSIYTESQKIYLIKLESVINNGTVTR